MCLYKVEAINYKGRIRYIVFQGENGPCPLIAVANYLILSQGVNVKPSSNGYVSQQYLFTLVKIYLNPQIATRFQDKAKAAEVKKQLSAVLPNLAKELFINPHANSIGRFDKTPELTLIEYLGIPLFHGWIIDSKDSKTDSALGGRSYNDLIDVDLIQKSMETFQEEISAECASRASLTSKDEDTLESKNDISQQMDDNATCKLIKDFRLNTKMQLTSNGVSCMCDHMLEEEQELAILYRNGHFHLMHMHNGTLHTLQTDLGTRTIHPNTAWQILNLVDGNDIFVTDNFCPINDGDEEDVSILYLKHQAEDSKRRYRKVLSDDKLMKEEIAKLEVELKELQKQKTEKALENFALEAAAAAKHEKELLESLEKEKVKKERKAKRKMERKLRAHQVDGTAGATLLASGTTSLEQEKSVEVIPDGAPEAAALQQEQSTEAIPDVAPETTALQQEQSTEAIPNVAPGTTPPQQETNIEVTTDVTPAVASHQQEQNNEVIPDFAPGTTPPQQQHNIEVTPDGTGCAPLQQQNAKVILDRSATATEHQQEKVIANLPYNALWVAGRFLKFITDFNYYGKSETPYFEGEIEAMKYRNLYEMSVQYSDIRHDCEELAIVIRDHYDSVLEDLRGSVVKYLVAHGVDEKKAEEAVLKIHGRPTSYRSFVDFAEENKNAFTQSVDIYMKTSAKITTELGRRIPRGYLRYIIDMHKKGYCWKGEWKASDMKVRSDGNDFLITKVPDYKVSKEGMKEDIEKFFEILFPYYEHESDQVSGEIEKKKVLPSYFLQFKEDCMGVPDPEMEPVKLQNFQKFLGSYPAFKSPETMSTFIGDLFISCDNLRGHDPVFQPLQMKETLQVGWKSAAKSLCVPFLDVYWHFTVEVYEHGYWFFLKFLRNFIQHMRMDIQDHDIAISGVMIGHHLEKIVPPFILFVLNNCDMNSLFLSTSWKKFEESELTC